MLYIGDANTYKLCLQIRGNFCGYSSKCEKMHSDAIQAAVVDSLMTSEAFDILPRPAFRGYASIADANKNELCSRIRGNFCGCCPKRKKRHSYSIKLRSSTPCCRQRLLVS
jgi:hypothetical protein